MHKFYFITKFSQKLLIYCFHKLNRKGKQHYQNKQQPTHKILPRKKISQIVNIKFVVIGKMIEKKNVFIRNLRT